VSDIQQGTEEGTSDGAAEDEPAEASADSVALEQERMEQGQLEAALEHERAARRHVEEQLEKKQRVYSRLEQQLPLMEAIMDENQRLHREVAEAKEVADAMAEAAGVAAQKKREVGELTEKLGLLREQRNILADQLKTCTCQDTDTSTVTTSTNIKPLRSGRGR